MHLGITDWAELLDDSELFFTGKVVADVMVEDARRARRVWLFDKNRDGDRRSAAWTEYLTALLARQFSRCPLISPQIEDYYCGQSSGIQQNRLDLRILRNPEVSIKE